MPQILRHQRINIKQPLHLRGINSCTDVNRGTAVFSPVVLCWSIELAVESRNGNHWRSASWAMSWRSKKGGTNETAKKWAAKRNKPSIQKKLTKGISRAIQLDVFRLLRGAMESISSRKMAMGNGWRCKDSPKKNTADVRS